MIWRNHRLFTASAVFCLTGDPIGAVVASSASTFPDVIEGVDYSRQTYYKDHRKTSHWFVPYAVAMMAAWAFSGAQMPMTILSNLRKGYIPFAGPGLVMAAASLAFCAALGAFLHIAEDAICGRVPLWNPKKKTFGIKLFTVRSPMEDVFVFSCSIAMILLRLFLIGANWEI